MQHIAACLSQATKARMKPCPSRCAKRTGLLPEFLHGLAQSGSGVGAQDLSQGGYGGGASQTALVSSVSCPTGGGGLLAELSRRQGQSQMETDGWEGDATAVVRPPVRLPLCSLHGVHALTESAGGSPCLHRM